MLEGKGKKRGCEGRITSTCIIGGFGTRLLRSRCSILGPRDLVTTSSQDTVDLYGLNLKCFLSFFGDRTNSVINPKQVTSSIVMELIMLYN